MKIRNTGLGRFLPDALRHTIDARRLRAEGVSEAPEQEWPWQTDPAYLNVCRQMGAIGSEMYQDEMAAYLLYFRAAQAASLAGDAAEVGVYRGGSAKMLAQVFGPAGKTLHLFDTFAGMPETNPGQDMLSEGIFGDTSLASVTALLADYPNVVLYPGFFPDTAGPIIGKTFCFVHIDGDIYQTTRDAIEFFYPRMERGGIMLFHDYVQYDCPGVHKAVHEFFDPMPEPIIYTPKHQCLVVKL